MKHSYTLEESVSRMKEERMLMNNLPKEIIGLVEGELYIFCNLV